MKWSGSEPPKFPPHTTAFEGRVPGLLHLGFRTPDGELQDLLFVDAPGEWFQQWAVNREAAGAEGARWAAAHADVFVLFADCAALAGDKRGEARAILRQIIERLRSERRGRPVLLLWSKSDIPISAEMRSSVEKASEGLGKGGEFRLSVMPQPPKDEVQEEPFLEVMETILGLPQTQARLTIEPEVVGDRFLSYRGLADA